MKIAYWANRHARPILFLLVVLCGAGIAASLKLPVSLFPRVNFPRIRLHLDAGERPAERMVVEVTRPVEESLRAVPGIRRINSTSSRGGAELWLSFDWGEDMTMALLQSESQLNKILPTLPQGTTFEIMRMDPTVFPVIAYSLTSKSRSLSQLRDIAQFELRPILSRVNGVARIGVAGGSNDEYRVTVDSAKLRQHGLAISDVASALASANILTAVGTIDDRYKLDLVVTDTQLKSVGDISSTILHSGATGIVRLSDVAAVYKAVAPQTLLVTANGDNAVELTVLQQPGGNTVQIAADIRDTLQQENKRIPPDVKLTCWYDQSDLITQSATGVRDAVLIGVGLAALVLLLFLRNWRITLIAALSVPVVLGITTLLLYVLGQSFNIMTLGGMAAAVGLIIDDAIVMSEHIVRRLQHSRAGNAANTVLDATNEFTRPLTGSSLSTIIIHIPPAFMIGVIGAFFATLSLSMASSLVISFLVAWLVIPVLAAKILAGHIPPEKAHKADHPIYHAIMHGALKLRWLAPLLIIGMVIAGYVAYERVPSGFMPEMDEGGFVLDYVGPPGTSLPEMDRMLKQVEAIIRKTPDVESFSRRTGFSLGEDLSESNTGDFFIRLKHGDRRDIDEVMEDIRKQVEHTVPGLNPDLSQQMEDLIGDLTGNPKPVVVTLSGENDQELLETADKVARAIEKVPDVLEVKNGIVLAGDALDVRVDRTKASLEGVDPDAISKSLADLLRGSVTTQIQQGEKLLDVRVWIPSAQRDTTRDVADLPIKAPDGHIFPLSRVATLETIVGQPEITREDLRRVVSVTARSNRDLGSTIRDVRDVLDKPGFLPSTVRYTLGGLYEQQQIAFRGLIEVIAAGAALVFLLLLFLYSSYRVAICIMLTTLTAIAFVLLTLWVTSTQLNISSLMGIVMIVGNVTEVAIFYYSEFAELSAPSSSERSVSFYERLIEAGGHRMRAITMTTVAAILALLPLATGIGGGSEMLQPLAISIIAGLVIQLPLVLVVLPCLLAITGKNRVSVNET